MLLQQQQQLLHLNLVSGCLLERHKCASNEFRACSKRVAVANVKIIATAAVVVVSTAEWHPAAI